MEDVPEEFDFTAVPAPAPTVTVVHAEEAVVAQVEKVTPPTPLPIILPGVPSPTRPFKLRFGLRNKM